MKPKTFFYNSKGKRDMNRFRDLLIVIYALLKTVSGYIC